MTILNLVFIAFEWVIEIMGRQGFFVLQMVQHINEFRDKANFFKIF